MGLPVGSRARPAGRRPVGRRGAASRSIETTGARSAAARRTSAGSPRASRMGSTAPLHQTLRIALARRRGRCRSGRGSGRFSGHACPRMHLREQCEPRGQTPAEVDRGAPRRSGSSASAAAPAGSSPVSASRPASPSGGDCRRMRSRSSGSAAIPRSAVRRARGRVARDSCDQDREGCPNSDRKPIVCRTLRVAPAGSSLSDVAMQRRQQRIHHGPNQFHVSADRIFAGVRLVEVDCVRAAEITECFADVAEAPLVNCPGIQPYARTIRLAGRFASVRGAAELACRRAAGRVGLGPLGERGPAGEQQVCLAFATEDSRKLLRALNQVECRTGVPRPHAAHPHQERKERTTPNSGSPAEPRTTSAAISSVERPRRTRTYCRRTAPCAHERVRSSSRVNEGAAAEDDGQGARSPNRCRDRAAPASLRRADAFAADFA